jgi:hypothetical protein
VAVDLLRTRSPLAIRLVLLLGAAALGAAAACTDDTSGGQKSPGDDPIYLDSSAQTPMDNGDDSGDDGFFARVDSYAPPDGYVPFDWCTQCACPSGTYCFGGGSGYTNFSGDCHTTAAALEEGGALAIGCYPFPSVCANEPSCECLIETVQPYLPCYPVCSITTNIVYCPNP